MANATKYIDVAVPLNTDWDFVVQFEDADGTNANLSAWGSVTLEARETNSGGALIGAAITESDSQITFTKATGTVAIALLSASNPLTEAKLKDGKTRYLDFYIVDNNSRKKKPITFRMERPEEGEAVANANAGATVTLSAGGDIATVTLQNVNQLAAATTEVTAATLTAAKGLQGSDSTASDYAATGSVVAILDMEGTGATYVEAYRFEISASGTADNVLVHAMDDGRFLHYKGEVLFEKACPDLVNRTTRVIDLTKAEAFIETAGATRELVFEIDDDANEYVLTFVGGTTENFQLPVGGITLRSSHRNPEQCILRIESDDGTSAGPEFPLRFLNNVQALGGVDPGHVLIEGITFRGPNTFERADNTTFLGTIDTGTNPNRVNLNQAPFSNSILISENIGSTVDDKNRQVTIAGAGVAGADLTTRIDTINSGASYFDIDDAASTDVTDAQITYTPASFQTWLYFNDVTTNAEHTFTMKNCRIERNFKLALSLGGVGAALLEDCKIWTKGGQVNAFGSNGQDPKPSFTARRCYFDGGLKIGEAGADEADDADGNGIYLSDNVSLLLEDCTFGKNAPNYRQWARNDTGSVTDEADYYIIRRCVVESGAAFYRAGNGTTNATPVEFDSCVIKLDKGSDTTESVAKGAIASGGHYKPIIFEGTNYLLTDAPLDFSFAPWVENRGELIVIHRGGNTANPDAILITQEVRNRGTIFACTLQHDGGACIDINPTDDSTKIDLGTVKTATVYVEEETDAATLKTAFGITGTLNFVADQTARDALSPSSGDGAIYTNAEGETGDVFLYTSSWALVSGVQGGQAGADYGIFARGGDIVFDSWVHRGPTLEDESEASAFRGTGSGTSFVGGRVDVDNYDRGFELNVGSSWAANQLSAFALLARGMVKGINGVDQDIRVPSREYDTDLTITSNRILLVPGYNVFTINDTGTVNNIFYGRRTSGGTVSNQTNARNVVEHAPITLKIPSGQTVTFHNSAGNVKGLSSTYAVTGPAAVQGVIERLASGDYMDFYIIGAQ